MELNWRSFFYQDVRITHGFLQWFPQWRIFNHHSQLWQRAPHFSMNGSGMIVLRPRKRTIPIECFAMWRETQSSFLLRILLKRKIARRFKCGAVMTTWGWAGIRMYANLSSKMSFPFAFDSCEYWNLEQSWIAWKCLNIQLAVWPGALIHHPFKN